MSNKNIFTADDIISSILFELIFLFIFFIPS